ncbi:sigma-70 family RNA polymerase sigma factor [bacterium]|nr:MAG: sigma-70 family RNA polymerase sigma factor [bacterium]
MPDGEPTIDASRREEFEALLKPMIGLAFRYASRLSGDRDSGLDLVQDASLIAYRSFHQFSAGTSFKAWFLRILTHRYYRTRQAASRTVSVPIGEVPELFLYFEAKRMGLSMEGDPAAILLGKSDGDTVCAALERLPDDYRVVAILHFLSNMTYDECAETLGIPVGTVRSRLHRARKLLQVALWQIAEERGYVLSGKKQ